jgi:hypothetical protein
MDITRTSHPHASHSQSRHDLTLPRFGGSPAEMVRSHLEKMVEKALGRAAKLLSFLEPNLL